MGYTKNPDSIRKTIRELLPRHFRAIDMMIADHSNAVIADTLGVSRKSIETLRKSPNVQAEIARRRKEDRTGEVLALDRDATMGKARSILTQALEPAAEKMVTLMKDANDQALQQKSAQYILDMAFGKAGGQTQVGVAINVTAEHAQLINLAIKESNRENTFHSTNSPAADSSEGG